MKYLKILIIAVFAGLVIAFFTKPSDSDCKEKAAQKAIAYLGKEKSNFFVDAVLEKAAEQGLSIEDNILYKTIYFSVGGYKKKIGWAAYSMIQVDMGK